MDELVSFRRPVLTYDRVLRKEAKRPLSSSSNIACFNLNQKHMDLRYLSKMKNKYNKLPDMK